MPYMPNMKKTIPKKKPKKDPCARVVSELLDPKGADGDAVQSWRVFRIMAEFVQGFELLREHGLAATFWGSARLEPTDQYYKAAEELAAKLAKDGFSIISVVDQVLWRLLTWVHLRWAGNLSV